MLRDEDRQERVIGSSAGALRGMTPVAPTVSLRSHVFTALSSAVISGEIPAGTLLSVPRLAAQFAVSATPVREAMLDLESRGFVESVRNKGFRVAEVSDEALREVIEVRLLLEPQAMRDLAARFDPGTLPALEEIVARIEAGARAASMQQYLEADLDFHLRLTGMLGNSLLVETVANLRSRTRLVGLVSLAGSAALTASAAEHRELLGLLAAGDAEAAGELMRRHVSHALGWWAGAEEIAH